MSSVEVSQPKAPPRILKRANDVCAKGVLPPKHLFDEFWNEGDVALLFGEHSVGKSFLGIEIAEALARGRPIEGLEMPTTRRNVLYVDLVLSDEQFGYRYSFENRAGRRLYQFSANLFRDRPAEGEDLIEWLREVVAENKIKVIIIDDLSIVSRTDDGTQQVLELIRELRVMARRHGISSLVLADSHPYIRSRETAEHDLRRRRVLCAHADSVFSLSRVENTPWHHLVQTRAQSNEIAWTQRQPAHLRFTTREEGFPGFEFVAMPLTEQQRAMICRIRFLRECGHKFRSIADQLDISKSKAERLFRKWNPSLEPRQEQVHDGEVERQSQRQEQEASEYGEYKANAELEGEPSSSGTQAPGLPAFEHPDDEAIDREDRERYNFDPDEIDDEDPDDIVAEHSPNSLNSPNSLHSQVPFAAALRRRSIHDLDRDYDQNGEEIFVESREEHSGKPKVWYKRHQRSGNYSRYDRDSFGVIGTAHGPSPLLPPDREIALATPGRAPPSPPTA